MNRTAWRLLALLALVISWSFIDSVTERPLWSSCHSYECITSWEKEGLM